MSESTQQNSLNISSDTQKPKNFRDTLIVIGNGFDIWQGLPTTAMHFDRYFRRHQKEILQKLHIPAIEKKEEGRPVEYGTSLDLIYGASTGEFEIYSDFWYEFEEALGDIEDETIIRFFGTDKSDIEDLKRNATNSWRILKYTFSHWIQTVSIPKSPLPLSFPSSCLFLTFNYTQTLQKRLHIDERNIYHIHGCVQHPDSIIFGHNSCHERGFDILRQFGGSFEAGYYLEELLYKTDKKIALRIKQYKKFLHNYHYLLRDIQQIYIVGHSLGEIDEGYFRFIHKSINPKAQWHISFFSEQDKERACRLVHRLKLSSRQYRLYSSIDECLNPFTIQLTQG